MISWKICTLSDYKDDIERLFAENQDHKHKDNYLKYPLFEYTEIARLGFYKDRLVYYSAAVERPEYNGSIRVMTRHTRSRLFNWDKSEDIARGTETLDTLTDYALVLGYDDIWFSREESPAICKLMKKQSKHDWTIQQEEIPLGGVQWTLRYKP